MAAERKRALFLGAIFSLIFVFLPTRGLANSIIEELKKEIEARNEEIRKLEEEAEKYRKAVAETQSQAQTLQAEIGRLKNAIGRLRREISVTEAGIKKTELEIGALSVEISQKEASIKKLSRGLAGLLEAFSESERAPLVVYFFKSFLVSDFFRELDYLKIIQTKMSSTLSELKDLKAVLETQKLAEEDKKTELASLKTSLAGRKYAQEAVQKEQENLLKITRNEEKRYQALLKEQEEKREALEQEIRELEDKIRITIDPSSLPRKGSGVLGYPLPEIDLKSCWAGGAGNCVTQFFGRTSFSQAGGYGGKRHNGMDFRADIATPVLAAEHGIIESVGDTDRGCRGASYGKWVLIRHPNNLSTLYAHLSSVNVSAGRGVARGDVIGYSGKTGYATGPHLHFTVFATQAVQVESIRSRVCGTTMTLPIAATNGYLDPLDYL